MFGKIAGVISTGLGIIAILVTLLGSSGFIAAPFMLGAAITCILLGALLWEVGSCSVSLAAIAKDQPRSADDSGSSQVKEQVAKSAYQSMSCPKCGTELNALATVCQKCKTSFPR
jgi:ribosomal protein L40E